jgi:pimeloyl-ACP methyl ester carboxylesterase
MNASSNFITVDGRNVYVESAGQGPAIVFAHAAFVDRRQWNMQWEPFAARYRAIRYDLGGFGKSDRLDRPISRWQELCGVLDALDIERAALIGCSMSGSAVVRFALAHPDRVSALVPVSAVPSGIPMVGEEPPEVEEMFEAWEAGDFSKASELQIRIWFDGPHRRPEHVSQEQRRLALEMNLIAVKNRTLYVDDGYAEPGPPIVERLHEISTPTLAIAGVLDHELDVTGTRYIAEHVPVGAFLAIPNAAHVPNMDDPAMFNDAVLRFLDANLHE